MKLRSLLAILVLGLHATCSLAEEVPSYEPANFPSDPSRIIRRINFPDTDRDVFVRVFCESYLTRRGNLQRSFCASEYPDADPYIIAVTARIDRSRLKPARVDGALAPVWFQYTVQFEKSAGAESIKLFPHHFVGVEGSGEGYTGPQRYRASRKPPCQTWYDFWITLDIPAHGGRPTRVVLENPGNNTLCADFMRALAEDGDFIPAFRDGTAIAAQYRERWWKVLPAGRPAFRNQVAPAEL